MRNINRQLYLGLTEGLTKGLTKGVTKAETIAAIKEPSSSVKRAKTEVKKLLVQELEGTVETILSQLEHEVRV